MMDQVERPGDVGVDDPHDLGKILIEKGLSQTAAGIGEQDLDRSAQPLRDAVELVDTIGAREVGFDRFDCRAEAAQFTRRLLDPRLVCGDDEVEAVLRAAFGEFVADAGRGAGDESQGAGVLIHLSNLRSGSGRRAAQPPRRCCQWQQSAGAESGNLNRRQEAPSLAAPQRSTSFRRAPPAGSDRGRDDRLAGREAVAPPRSNRNCQNRIKTCLI